MRKFVSAIIFLLLFALISLLNPLPSYAVEFDVFIKPIPIYANSEKDLTFTIDSDALRTFSDRTTYTLELRRENYRYALTTARKELLVANEGKSLEGSITLRGELAKKGEWTYTLWDSKPRTDYNKGIRLLQGTYYVYPPQQGNFGTPQLQVQSPVQQFTKMPLVITNVLPDETYTIFFGDQKSTIYIGKLQDADGASVVNNNPYTVNVPIDVGSAQNNTKVICLRQGRPFVIFGLNCDYSSQPFDVIPIPPAVSPTTLTSGQAGIPNPSIPPEEAIFNILPPCAKGYLIDDKCTGVDTGLGIVISTEPQAFVRSIFSLVLGIAGGIALVLIIVSGYRFMTSQGNPESVKAATEQLTSAIIGLLFIVFSFVILQAIGVNILSIPGFQP